MFVTAPLVLSEAKVSLFLVGPDGLALTAQPVWFGADARRLRLASKFQTVVSAPSGCVNPITRHLNLEHSISIESVAVFRQAHTPDGAPAEFQMVRNAEYVMAIAWQQGAPGDRWMARVYYGVKCNAEELESEGEMEFTGARSFSAERFTPHNGKGAITC